MDSKVSVLEGIHPYGLLPKGFRVDIGAVERAQIRGRALRSQAFKRLFIDPVVRPVRHIARVINDYTAERQTIEMLERLSDQTLRDIGIERPLIPLRVREYCKEHQTSRLVAVRVKPAGQTLPSANDGPDTTREAS